MLLDLDDPFGYRNPLVRLRSADPSGWLPRDLPASLVERLVAAGLVEWQGDRLFLTYAGRRLRDQIPETLPTDPFAGLFA